MKHLKRVPEGCPCCGEVAFYLDAFREWGVCTECGGCTAAMTPQNHAFIEPEGMSEIQRGNPSPAFGGES